MEGGGRVRSARHSHEQGPQPAPGWEKKINRKQIQFKIKIKNQIHSNLIRSKQDLPELGKFEIKYGCKVFEIGNNFPYRNLLRFWMDFEQKFRESSMSWKQGKNDWNFLGTRILMKLGQQLSFLQLIERKNK
jgi:hypothetical protein